MGILTVFAIFCAGASVLASVFTLSACILSARVSRAEEMGKRGIGASPAPGKLKPIH